MPNALLRPCAEPNCPTLVERGRCPLHARQREQARGSASARGYNARWVKAVAWFKAKLNALAINGVGVGAICGGRLPGAPVTTHSCCLAEGRINATGLQVDHIEPHRGDQRTFWNPLKWQLLCASCHSIKTASEDGGFGYTPGKSSAALGRGTAGQPRAYGRDFKNLVIG